MAEYSSVHPGFLSVDVAYKSSHLQIFHHLAFS